MSFDLRDLQHSDQIETCVLKFLLLVRYDGASVDCNTPLFVRPLKISVLLFSSQICEP